MPVYKLPHGTTAPNTLGFDDSKISLKAKGLLGYCLTKSSDTQITIKGLAAEPYLISHKHGYKFIQRAMGELRTAGYAVHRKLHDARGHWSGGEWDIYALPVSVYWAVVSMIEVPTQTAPMAEPVNLPQTAPMADSVHHPDLGATETAFRAERLEAPFDGDREPSLVWTRATQTAQKVLSRSCVSLDLNHSPTQEGLPKSPLGPSGSDDRPCFYDPMFICSHVKEVYDMIRTVTPLKRLNGGRVNEGVFETVHRLSLEDISLIYAYRLDQGDEVRVLHPNVTLAPAGVDRHLATAQAWKDVQDAPKPEPPPCTHPAERLIKTATHMTCQCGEYSEELLGAGEVSGYVAGIGRKTG